MEQLYWTIICSFAFQIAVALPLQTNLSTTVIIDHEEYSLLEAPERDSKVVLDAVEDVTEPVLYSLEELVTNLNTVGTLTRLAYNGFTGYTSVQNEVQSLGIRITELADMSALTIHRFGTTARSVVEHLELAFGFLLDGYEEVALEFITGCEELARNMEKEALRLADDFSEEADNTETALEKIKSGQNYQNQKLGQIRRERTNYRDQKNVQIRKINTANSNIQYYRDKLSRVKRDLGIFSVIVPLVYGIVKHNEAKDERRKAEDERRKAEEAEKKEEERKRLRRLIDEEIRKKMAAIQEMEKFADKIEALDRNEDSTSITINALHMASGKMKSLSSVMMNIATFWRSVEDYCESLKPQKIERMFEIYVSNSTENDHIKFYTSEPFKKVTVEHYASWVALEVVSDRYMAQIKETRKELYSFIRENPTIEESRRIVKELAKHLRDLLEKEKKHTQEVNKSLVHKTEEDAITTTPGVPYSATILIE